jgi:hypothetical protein
MSDNPKHPEIIDYGGRRRKFDRWLNPERPTVPECRSRRQRRSGYDRRTIKNNADIGQIGHLWMGTNQWTHLNHMRLM